MGRREQTGRDDADIQGQDDGKDSEKEDEEWSGKWEENMT